MIAPGSRYVALGSSYAAGPGIPPIIHRGALRSGRNYPHQVAQALSLELTDVTSSGATTANIMDTPQRTLSGTFPPQVSAVTADTRLVTVTAGGNDAGYIGALTKLSVASAVGRRLPGVHLRASAWLAAWAGTAPPPSAFVQVADGLAEVVRAVRSRAPQVQVVLVDYLTVVETEPAGARSGRGTLPLTPEQARQVEIAGAGLAAAFERAASVTGAGLVRASLESAGHGAGSAQPWVTGLKFGNPLTGGAVPWHPNLTGATAVARLVVEFLSG
jgi:lysophospholipase L1-like esterase